MEFAELNSKLVECPSVAMLAAFFFKKDSKVYLKSSSFYSFIRKWYRLNLRENQKDLYHLFIKLNCASKFICLEFLILGCELDSLNPNPFIELIIIANNEFENQHDIMWVSFSIVID